VRRPVAPGSGRVQPPTESTPPRERGDEDELYRRYHRDLHRAVARAVRAPHELIEDERAVFAWLRMVAIHEAYRLLAIERREASLRSLRTLDEDWREVAVEPGGLDDAVEALEALRILASLPSRQRDDLALKIAGYTYEEIRTRSQGRTITNVNKSLVKARRRIRQARAASGAAS
jgi:DNA-directed RNA polymerase specialized sigma24 family protein